MFLRFNVIYCNKVFERIIEKANHAPRSILKGMFKKVKSFGFNLFSVSVLHFFFYIEFLSKFKGGLHAH